MTTKPSEFDMEKLRAELQQLFKDAGYVNDELERFFEKAVQLYKLNGTRRTKATSHTMSSKLSDALRE